MKRILLLLFVTCYNVVSAQNWSLNGSDIYYTGGRVGVNTSTPTVVLDVNGDMRVGNSTNFLYYNGSADINFRYLGRGSGGRAIVHDEGNTLVLNFAGDFSGGTKLGASTYFAAATGVSYLNAGNVGLGTTNPMRKLHLFGITSSEMILEENNALPDYRKWNLVADGGTAATPSRFYIRQLNDAGTDGIVPFLISGGGNVGIGTMLPSEKLCVNGTVLAKKVRVATGWADYVFDSGYQLKSLPELGAFIQANKHLPGIPASSEVEQHGVDLGDMVRLQQEKIEELTLYLLEEHKKMAAQQDELAELKKRLSKLEVADKKKK
ncbi:hypothetical protein [Deminuibacter soli]|uniref:BZIP transcription factor n=1 Tax=Deminuibacter soli TaxID=2291815 RepID=A0A3E1NIE6_9BACT|nr:hypothetical protein [Deminuibacter soli]RFM27651.1 hypothetical protein DXN05_13140 [Deminuibacter soli]